MLREKDVRRGHSRGFGKSWREGRGARIVGAVEEGCAMKVSWQKSIRTGIV
jgi:hypothetical protein